MDIFIYGMDMPKDGCHHTIAIYSDGTVATGEQNDYKAIEVKSLHDDLVDREWVRDSINHSCWLEYNDYLEAFGIVNDAPTIIEAEGK